MALAVRARYKPDAFRSGLEAIAVGVDPLAGTGTVILPVQAIQYDTVDIPDINAVTFGDPSVERFITILYEGQVQLDIGAMVAMPDNATRNTQLRTSLDQWSTNNKNLILNLSIIVRLARKMNARLIP